MVDFTSWQKHVNSVVEAQGRWWGLGDGDGNPIMDLPTPIDNESPEQWLDTPDITVKFPARGENGLLPATELLVMGALDGFDASGQLPVADSEYTLLVAVPDKSGGVRRLGGLISHCTADDPDNDGIPAELTINALNFADVWNTVPAVSWPAAWWAATPYPRTSDEAGIPYSRSWLMAKIELAKRATFTWKEGKAGFVIRRLAQESLDAVMMTQQDPNGTRWVDDPYHVVEVPEVDDTPVVSLRAEDSMLWDTVVGQAKNAGVLLGARLWWPGDPEVRCWSQATSSMSPAQVDISPSQGASARTLGYRSFAHPMVVLEVREV